MNLAKLISLFLAVGITACGGGGGNTVTPVIPAEELTPVKLPPGPPAGTTYCENVGCEDNNKQVVEQIYTDIINGVNTGLVASIYHENFIQHDADISYGIDGQVAYFTELTANSASYVATVKHIVADKDYVAVHWHFSANPENEFTGTARIDLFRLFDNEITEHWSQKMTPNASTASGNSVFSDLYTYLGNQANNDTAIEEDNKTMVTSFYLDLFNNKNLALIDDLVDPSYIQHNHWVENGSAALRNFVANRAAGGLSIFLSLSEDDMVWTFSGEGIGNLKTVDLWRVDNNKNKIVEHWDVF